MAPLADAALQGPQLSLRESAGMVPMQEPVTELTLETPAGLIRVRADCSGGLRRVIQDGFARGFRETIERSLRQIPIR